ncbi:MAG: hypothetical protein ACRDM0_23180, partial [Thermoleophilaceae bacterium]
GEPAVTSLGNWHEDCKPAPAPEQPRPWLELPRERRRRVAHMPAKDRERVLAWLADHGPATGRMVAWALNLPAREVTMLLRSLEGGRVESVGVVMTGRRGHPPTVWRVREAVAA